jgi:hypothetical protein
MPMLTVSWCPPGLFLADILQKGIHFDAGYFCSNSLIEIVQNSPSGSAEDLRGKLMPHYNKASPDTARCTTGWIRADRSAWARHPAFSPDLAPSDFYVFGKVKMVLMNATFRNDYELSQCGMAVRNVNSREELEAVVGE